MTPSSKEQEEAIAAVKGWLNGPSGPGFRVLRTLLWMAERGQTWDGDQPPPPPDPPKSWKRVHKN